MREAPPDSLALQKPADQSVVPEDSSMALRRFHAKMATIQPSAHTTRFVAGSAQALFGSVGAARRKVGREAGNFRVPQC